MGYFRELPNIDYLSPLLDRNNSDEYIEAKNLFKRVKLRDDIQNSLTSFEKYQIGDDMRPDQVADELYGSVDLDWVVLISAGITNVRDQWPLSSRDIYEYAYDKYGSDLNATLYYETIEVKDSKGRIILPKGQVVDYNFKSPKPKTDTEPTTSYVKFWDSGLEQVVTKTNITRPVSNYEYETAENEKKRSIYVLRKAYIQQFLNDTRDLLTYGKSTQYYRNSSGEILKRSDNIRIKSP